MNNLNFGTDIRIENLMLLEAISTDDAEIICSDIHDFAEAFVEACIAIPVEDLWDGWDVREYFADSGIGGFLGLACTPAIEVSECGSYTDNLSWGCYVRFPVYGKDIDELKEKAIGKVADYRKKKNGKQGGGV